MTGFQANGTGLLVPTEPEIQCTICGERYPATARGSLEVHVEACYREHEAEIQAEAEKLTRPVLDHDEEKIEWVKKYGKA